ncbi:MAG: MATE family efflux transporter [Firmicutes bacterium]|nr:MATE family efflux transporter [Bacillota bacterium]
MAQAVGRRTRDMTEGSIVKQIILFSLPLMLGNIFQMLYNTVDSIVVGNFVGKEALAAVGSTTMIVNMLVFFFNGFSVGACVIIGQYFGAKEMDKLHRSVETTMMMTFIFCVVMTLVGVFGVRPMLRFMSTPEDVFEDATTYLTIYFWGISGLLIYNMGSGILRAVGDTTRPLYFLILTSVLNIILDLVFVIVFHLGIAGVAYATIISQMVSAVLTLVLLTRTSEIYKLSWKDLGIDGKLLKQIFNVGLPAGIQQVITAFSNVFVQSYVNFFGSSVMAGWSCYNKLDSFIMLPMSSMALAATTYVSQNIGAKKYKRADQGTFITIAMTVAVTAIIGTVIVIFAVPAIGLFSQDASVIEYGVLFIRWNTFFLLVNCVNHVLAASLRGRGDSKGPMVIMLLAFVGIRQLYLFTVTHFVANTPLLVGLGYPVGWSTCFILEVTYWLIKRRKWPKGETPEATR